MKNHYEILGLEQNASFEDIKRAYRKLSVKFHPDKNEGDEYFSPMFRQINDAYSVLSDVEKRSSYDKMRARAEESQSLSESLKNREKELNYLEEQLRQRAVYDADSTYRKTNKTDSIKSNPIPAFIRKPLKYLIYVTIMVLIVVVVSTVNRKQEKTKPGKQHASIHGHHKHHYKTVKSVINDSTERASDAVTQNNLAVPDSIKKQSSAFSTDSSIRNN